MGDAIIYNNGSYIIFGIRRSLLRAVVSHSAGTAYSKHARAVERPCNIFAARAPSNRLGICKMNCKTKESIASGYVHKVSITAAIIDVRQSGAALKCGISDRSYTGRDCH